MYRVIVAFTDIQDNDHKYLPGNEYPRKGLTVSPERLEELSTTANKRHVRLIESDGKDVIAKSAPKAKTELVEPNNEEIKPVPDDFMNPPVESDDPVVEVEEKPKRRGRKKNAD